MLFNKWYGREPMCCPRPEMNECQPIMEPMVNKCIEKEFVHEVPHICPVNTHVINKHIYKHTYAPQFTCTEENQVVNIDCGGCNF